MSDSSELGETGGKIATNEGSSDLSSLSGATKHTRQTRYTRETSHSSRLSRALRTKNYGVFAHRNPLSPWSVGEMRLRFVERMARGLLLQAPPRIALVPPDDGPVGFSDGLLL